MFELNYTKMEEKFYEISHGWATKYFWLDPDWNVQKGENSEELIKKKVCDSFIPKSGTTSADILGNSLVLNIYSENLVEFLNKHNADLKTFPIKIVLPEKVKNKEIPNYYYVEPKSFIDSMRDGSYLSKSERKKFQENLDKWIRKKYKIYYEGHEVRKDFYNLSSWNQSDFFGAKYTKMIIVTDRLKKIIEGAKLKNIKFTELKILENGI